MIEHRIRNIFLVLVMTVSLCLPAFGSASLPLATVSSQSEKAVKRQMKSIKENLKNLKASEALKAVESLRKDSAAARNPQLQQYAVEACKILNDKENEKIYLKAKPDTTAYFNTLYNVFQNILITDSAEMRLNSGAKNCVAERDTLPATVKTKFRFRKHNSEYLNRNYPNLLTAITYFTAHNKWSDVQKFVDLSIRVGQSPVIASAAKSLPDSAKLAALAVTHVDASYRTSDFKGVERHSTLALCDTLSREYVLERLVYCEAQVKDTLRYAENLTLGNAEFPLNTFFFGRVIDRHLRHGNNAAALASAQRSLSRAIVNGEKVSSVKDKDLGQIYEAIAIAYDNMNQPKPCIEAAKNILKWNASHPRAAYYIGVSYYRLADEVEIPLHVTDADYQKAMEKRREFLREGRPYLEAYRRDNPEAVDAWAPLLYQTYLYLNLGAEFEEISRYVE